MKKYLPIIILLTFCKINYAQKEIDCDGFQKKAIGKYIVTNESIIDTLGNIVYTAKYGAFNLYSKIIVGNLLYEYNKENKLYRILNLKTKEPVIDFKIKSYQLLDNGYSIIEVNKKRDYGSENKNYWFIDKNGNKLCHLPKNAKKTLGYVSHSGFNDNLGKIQFHSDLFYGQHWSFGYIDKIGKIIIKSKYRSASSFYEGLAAVESKNDKGIFKWGFINKQGEKVISFKFSNKPSSFSEGLAIVENKNRKLGFINLKGEVVIEPKYYTTTGFYKGFAIVKKSFKTPYELINTKGETVHTFSKVRKFIYFGSSRHNSQRNDFIKHYINNNAVIAFLHGKIKPQVIDFKENILFENTIHNAFEKFTSGLSYKSFYDKTTKTRKMGFIDKKGKFVIIKSQNQF